MTPIEKRLQRLERALFITARPKKSKPKQEKLDIQKHFKVKTRK